MADNKSAKKSKSVKKKEENATHKMTVGAVCNCKKLNIREQADANARVLCVIDVGAEVKVSVERSVEGWYAVCTEAGIEGFCMKNYVKIA